MIFFLDLDCHMNELSLFLPFSLAEVSSRTCPLANRWFWWLYNESHIKLDVEDGGEVEWIRTEVVTPPGVSDPLLRHRFEVTRPRNEPTEILRSSS